MTLRGQNRAPGSLHGATWDPQGASGPPRCTPRWAKSFPRTHFRRAGATTKSLFRHPDTKKSPVTTTPPKSHQKDTILTPRHQKATISTPRNHDCRQQDNKTATNTSCHHTTTRHHNTARHHDSKQQNNKTATSRFFLRVGGSASHINIYIYIYIYIYTRFLAPLRGTF